MMSSGLMPVASTPISPMWRTGLPSIPETVSAKRSSATYSSVEVLTPHASVRRLRSEERLAIMAAAGFAGSGAGMSISA